MTGRLRSIRGEGLSFVSTELGEISCGLMSDLVVGADVVVVVRPESVVLHRTKPSREGNFVEGKVATVMFLGEYLDCSVNLGKAVLQTHQPHSLELRRGDTV